MGKAKKRKSQNKKTHEPHSDDENEVYNELEKNPRSSAFYHDEIDEFHIERDKILLESNEAGFSSDSDHNQEEVLALDDDSSGDDEDYQEMKQRLMKFKSAGFKDKIASDIEESEDEEDDRAWGGKKSEYYGADDDSEREGRDESDLETAVLEEKEALAIQKRLMEQLEEQDFGLDQFKEAESTTETKSIIKKDLSQLTKKEKIKLLKSESPELLDLLKDYKQKVYELKEHFLPLHDLVLSGVIPPSSGAEYISTKVSLYLSYCVNLSFYLMLKTKRTPVHNHPVIPRLVQYRKVIAQLEQCDAKIKPELDEVLRKLKNGEKIEFKNSEKSSKRVLKKKSQIRQDSASEGSSSETESESDVSVSAKAAKLPSKRTRTDQYETLDEQEALNYYNMMKKMKKTSDSEESVENKSSEDEASADESNGEATRLTDVNSAELETGEGDAEEKRAITYQISKNKGLTPKRKKEMRNPRVKMRMKYRKAKIRRKGQIREVRTEMSRYAGELSGIRANVTRSRKFKN